MTTAWPFGDLVPIRYSVIMADPPWHFGTWSAAGDRRELFAREARVGWQCWGNETGMFAPGASS